VLTVEALSTEGATTSEIEGEVLDRASVQSSVRRELGLKPDARRSGPKEQGVAEMLVDVHRTSEKPLTEAMLCSWHRMLMHGRADLRDVGRYRTADQPMEIMSGPRHAPRVHFGAPPSGRVPKEMARCEMVQPDLPGGREPLPGLAATILPRRKGFYAALEKASRTLEVTPWLMWFAGIAIEAQRRAIARVEFLVDKTRFLERLRGSLNDRQEKALIPPPPGTVRDRAILGH
jgi:Fic family protein